MKRILFVTILGVLVIVTAINYLAPEKSELDIIDRTVDQGEEPEEWFACNQDSDCVYIDNDVCQHQGNGLGWRAANKDFEEKFQAVQKTERAQNIVCTEMYLLPPEQDPICLNNICTQPE